MNVGQERACVYVRKSNKSDVAESQKSVVVQADEARRFIASKGWTLTQVYEDDAISGALWRDRPGLQRMLRDAEAGAFTHIVVFTLDRLGREQQGLMDTLYRLEERGVSVWESSTARLIDVSTDEAEVMTSFSASQTQMFRAFIRRQVISKAYHRARQGIVVGNPPYGYRAEGRKGEKTFVIVPEEADVIREIYARAADGQGARTIAAALNARRLPAPRQQGRAAGWSMSTVHAVLRRELYRGVFVYGKTSKKYRRELKRLKPGARREKGQIANPANAWVRVEKPELRIVDEAVAARVDLRIGDRRERYLKAVNRKGRRNPNMARGRFLLSGGLLLCPTCGANFEARVAPWHGLKNVYICSTRRRKPGACTNTLALPIDEADESVLSTIEGEVLGTGAINRLLDLVDTVEDDTIALTEARDRLTDEINRLVASIADGVPAKTLAPAIQERERERDRLNARLALPRPERADRERLRAALEQRSAEWRRDLRANPKVAMALVRRILGPITLWDPKDRHDWIPTGGSDSVNVTWKSKARVGELFDGLADQQVASPTGFEPVFWP